MSTPISTLTPVSISILTPTENLKNDTQVSTDLSNATSSFFNGLVLLIFIYYLVGIIFIIIILYFIYKLITFFFR